MELAYSLLKGSDMQIKEVASKFGYDNQGKFAIAFKKVHNILPSEINK
jgi:AraC-like DNA-binding protein